MQQLSELPIDTWDEWELVQVSVWGWHCQTGLVITADNILIGKLEVGGSLHIPMSVVINEPDIFGI